MVYFKRPWRRRRGSRALLSWLQLYFPAIKESFITPCIFLTYGFFTNLAAKSLWCPNFKWNSRKGSSCSLGIVDKIPIHGSVQGQGGQALEQLGRVENVSAHGRRWNERIT